MLSNLMVIFLKHTDTWYHFMGEYNQEWYYSILLVNMGHMHFSLCSFRLLFLCPHKCHSFCFVFQLGAVFLAVSRRLALLSWPTTRQSSLGHILILLARLGIPLLLFFLFCSTCKWAQLNWYQNVFHLFLFSFYIGFSSFFLATAWLCLGVSFS